MAIQSNLQFRGTIDNNIYYMHWGIPCIRTKPVSVNQTIATKKAASFFGLATTIGGCCRQELLPLLPNPKDRLMQHGLRNALQQYLPTVETNNNSNSLQSTMVDLNSQSSLQNLSKITTNCSFINNHSIALAIPDINPTEQLMVPKGTQYIQWQIMAIACSFSSPYTTASNTAYLNMQYTNAILPAQQVVLPLNKLENNVVLVAMALQYLTTNNQPVNNVLAWQPAAIVAIGRV
jgi:hypothetical protein